MHKSFICGYVHVPYRSPSLLCSPWLVLLGFCQISNPSLESQGNKRSGTESKGLLPFDSQRGRYFFEVSGIPRKYTNIRRCRWNLWGRWANGWSSNVFSELAAEGYYTSHFHLNAVKGLVSLYSWVMWRTSPKWICKEFGFLPQVIINRDRWVLGYRYKS